MFGIKIYMPWNNLGCLGFQVGEKFYMDFYIRPAWACYFRIGENRYTWPLRSFWRGPRKWR